MIRYHVAKLFIIINLAPFFLLCLQFIGGKYKSHEFEILIWLLVIWVPYLIVLIKKKKIKGSFEDKIDPYSFLFILILFFYSVIYWVNYIY